MKYSKTFERDYAWYLKWKDIFTFCGNEEFKSNIIQDVNGKEAKLSFYKFDSEGKIIPTSEPKLLFEIYRCKASINFHIKMWAQGRADGTLPGIEFSENYREGLILDYPSYETRYELLGWMIDSVENQKVKYYK